jgi:predicted CopG family antitoxin
VGNPQENQTRNRIHLRKQVQRKEGLRRNFTRKKRLNREINAGVPKYSNSEIAKTVRNRYRERKVRRPHPEISAKYESYSETIFQNL